MSEEELEQLIEWPGPRPDPEREPQEPWAKRDGPDWDWSKENDNAEP